MSHTTVQQAGKVGVSDTREKMNIVIAGHVDHGKSTIIGRMLADTDSLPKGKLQFVQDQCERNSKPFEYAFLLDALKDEQAQGITIDSARVFFKTEKRHYIIIDAPGHIEFLKNMVTGASRAEAALLVIDAHEGIQENSRRHGYMISMLGIRQIVVLVNKMDLVNYDEQTYRRIVEGYTEFLQGIDVEARGFVPVSGINGDNVASPSQNMPWYNGKTALEFLDAFKKEKPPVDKAFRMPVQDVYKFTKSQDARRIIAGTVETGQLNIGDEVVFYPSGKKSRVKSFESFNASPPEHLIAGDEAGFQLSEQIYIRRGELAARSDQSPPKVARRIKVNLFWMGREPMTKRKRYLIKVGAAKVECELEDITRVIDASALNSESQKDQIERHDVAECTLLLRKAMAFDVAEDAAATSRFVIVDDFEIRGGGIIREKVEDEQEWIREHVIMRNQKWETSMISKEQRAEKYNQKATLILVTGDKNAGKKTLSRALEARLLADGKIVYFIGIANILYGVDADIKIEHSDEHHKEHLRRLAEVAHLMLDAGCILIVTAVNLTEDDLEIIRATIDPDLIEVIWVGDAVKTDIEISLRVAWNEGVDWNEGLEANLNLIKGMLQDKGLIFNPAR
ncbi:adenylyl-sulfate kinase [Candidatus Sumerlaeota bacterium]|nr:adenylyl-sulfate kinase [Candidatus Sumerlaeota bacterium]